MSDGVRRALVEGVRRLLEEGERSSIEVSVRSLEGRCEKVIRGRV